MTLQGYALDASALLALLFREKGADIVAERLPNSWISAVNLSEVAAKMIDKGMPHDIVRAALARLDLTVIDFDRDHAMHAGALREATRVRGLSLGDRACLALAEQEGLIALTGDRAWSEIDADIRVELIR